MVKIKKNIVADKTDKIKYLKYRVLRPILKLNYSFYKSFNKETPWLAQETIDFLKTYLNKNLIGLEYGSGKSTSFLASKSKYLVSIENNQEWFNIVKKILDEKKLNNIDYIFSPENKPCDKDRNDVVSFPEKVKIKTFRDSYLGYINEVNSYEDNYFNYIIIDGRARVETFFASYPKLKKGGIIILDNSERKRYSPILDFMKDQPKQYHTTGLTDTIIWTKSN